jgi:Mn-dependent DtxR family transcriptional regulator
MVKKLDENHYLIYEKYSDLKLTGAGIIIAQNIEKNKDCLWNF